jgi:hypothetical protein
MNNASRLEYCRGETLGCVVDMEFAFGLIMKGTNMTTSVMEGRIADASLRRTARVAGVFYLFNILTILIGMLFFRGLVVPSDPAATATNVVAHRALFLFGSASDLISTTCSIVVAALFYELFKPVNKSLSLIAAFFRLIACAIAVIGYIFQLAPLQILGGTHHLSTQESQALALLLYTLHTPASHIVILFFGFHFVLIGYLIFSSTFMPRILGVLVVLAGFAGLTFLVPPFAIHLFPYFVAVGLLAEVSLTVWLLTKGANIIWKEPASKASW